MHDEFNKWVDLWDKACAEREISRKMDLEQEKADEEEQEKSDVCARQEQLYTEDKWRQTYFSWVQILQEQEGEKQEEKKHPVNPPVQAGTEGNDGEVKVTPDWSDGDNLNKLSEIKIELEKLERSLHGAEILGEKTNSILEKIKSLRDKVENLSDSVSGSKVS